MSQFGDIYQEDYFIDCMKPDIRIVKELPKELQSLDLEAIGSVVTDVDIAKKAKPSFYLKHILPLLMKNGVIHFVGFDNRLASDPIPYQLQRLRCRCNFHALQFTPKIQSTAALLIQRMRQNATHSGLLDENLVGPFASRMLIRTNHIQGYQSNTYLVKRVKEKNNYKALCNLNKLWVTSGLFDMVSVHGDRKDAFQEFVNEKVQERKRANREGREKRNKARKEMSQEVAAFESMRFYKFYPVASPDTPVVSNVKAVFINRYYGKGGSSILIGIMRLVHYIRYASQDYHQNHK